MYPYGYHLKDGLYFDRLASGKISISLVRPWGTNEYSVTEWVVEPNEFASAIAAVSRRGETGETFHEAEEFLTK